MKNDQSVICLMKVNVAEKRGAKGVLLYSDPIDFAQQGRDFVYPDSWWMPGMAVQLGSVYSGHGDPLTPFYPSVGTGIERLNFFYLHIPNQLFNILNDRFQYSKRVPIM